MPIIQMPGSAMGHAGIAAAGAMQGEAQFRQQLLQAKQLGARAQQQDFDNEATTRALDLREKSIEEQRTRYQMRDALKASGGVPISGAGTINMVTRLSELDRDTYEKLAPQLMAMGGFDENNPVTAEKLDQLENLPDIYAAISPYFADAVKRDDANWVANTMQTLERSYVDSPKVFDEDPEWNEWHQGLLEDYSSAMRSSSGNARQLLAPIFKQKQQEATRLQYLKQRRSYFTDQFNSLLSSGKYEDEDAIMAAQEKFSKMRTTDDPTGVWDETMIELDENYRRVYQKGIRGGYGFGAQDATNVRTQAQMAAALDHGMPDQMVPETPLDTFIPSEMPGVARALRGDGPERPVPASEFIKSLDRAEVPLDKPDLVAAHLEKMKAMKAKKEQEAEARREAAIDEVIYGKEVPTDDTAAFEKAMERANINQNDPDAVAAFRVKYDGFKKRRRNSVREYLK